MGAADSHQDLLDLCGVGGHGAVCFSTVFLSLSPEGYAQRLLMQTEQGEKGKHF